MSKSGGTKLSQWAKIKIVCKVVRGKLQKAHTMGYLTVPGSQVSAHHGIPHSPRIPGKLTPWDTSQSQDPWQARTMGYLKVPG